MVLRESKLVTIDFENAHFNLPNPLGELFSRQDLMGANGLLIVFTCNHCPYAVALWDRLIDLANRVSSQGVQTVAINPNINPNYPADSPEHMQTLIETKHLPFPYLVDSDQSVARLYEAQCTPDIYLLNNSFECVYHGRFDDNWKDLQGVQSHDLSDAIDALISGSPILKPLPSMGCSIKWNE